MNLLLDGGLVIGSFEYGINKSIFDNTGYFYNVKVRASYFDIITGKSKRPIHMLEADYVNNKIEKVTKDYGLRSFVDCKEGTWCCGDDDVFLNKVEGKYEERV